MERVQTVSFIFEIHFVRARTRKIHLHFTLAAHGFFFSRRIVVNEELSTVNICWTKRLFRTGHSRYITLLNKMFFFFGRFRKTSCVRLFTTV